MSRHLSVLWLLSLLWPGVFGFPGLRGPVSTTFEGALAIVSVGAAVLALATAGSLVQCILQPQLTYRAIGGAAASITCFCGVVVTIFWIGGAQARASLAGQVMASPSIAGRTLELLCDPMKASSPVARRFLYRELGLCVAYRGEDQSLHQFGPTDDDREARLLRLDSLRESARLQATLDQQARFSYAAGFAHLVALPIAMTSYLVWMRRKRGAS